MSPAERPAGPPIVLRADGGDGRGLGHVLRCLALAEAWCGPATLVVPAAVEPEARRRAGRVAVLDDGDDERLRDLVSDARWVVVDGYPLTDADLAVAGVTAEQTVRIDDHGHHPAPAAAVVVDANLGASPEPYLGGTAGATHLLGLAYALLRPTASPPATVRERADQVGVFLGGTPGPDLVTLVQQALARLDGGVQVHVFGGGDLDALSGARVVLHGLVDDVPQAAAQLDVGLAAAGTTTWELCRAGVPTVLVAAADNQVPIVEAVVAAGAALGQPRLLPDAATVAGDLATLLDDHDLRARLAERGRALVDGRGPARVAAALRSRDVVLRPAGADDESLLLDWANDADVRASSFDSHVIAADTHHVWLARRLADAEVGLYVAEDDRGPWGQIRFEPREQGTVELGFSIDATRRGEGLAAPLLRAGARRAFADLPGADRILGRVRPENHRSARAFDAAGFLPVDDQPHAFVADRREGW